MSELKTIANALDLLHASPNATTFFLTSYRTGRASVGHIAKRAKMDRSSAYNALEALEKLGLVEVELHNGRKVVVTRPPKAVIARLRTEIRKMRRHVDAIEENMPALLAAFASKDDRPVLQVFAGIDGLHRVMDDVLSNAQDEILLMSNFREEAKVFTKKDHDDFIDRRVKGGVTLRLLATDSKEARKIRSRDKSHLRTTRIVDGSDPFRNETYIYGDSIAMLSFNEQTGVIGFIVRSKEFAQAQRWMFEEIWKTYPDT